MVRLIKVALGLAVVATVAAACSSGGDDVDAVDEGAASGPNPIEFCVRYAAMVRDGFLQPADVLGASSAEIRTQIDGSVDDARFAAEVAPDDIAADIDVMVSGAEAFRGLLAEFGFDLVRLTREAEPDRIAEITELLTGPDFEAAAGRIDAYLDTECDDIAAEIEDLVAEDRPEAEEDRATVLNDLRGIFTESDLRLIFDRYGVGSIEELADRVVAGDIEFDELLVASDPAVIFNFGEDPVLDELWEACSGGDMVSCDRLRLDATPGTLYARFALSCGDRTDGSDAGSCVTQFGETIDDPDTTTTTTA